MCSRELTRVAGQVDEDKLCELALEMTASQVARTVSAFRTAAGTRIDAEPKRRLSMTSRPDGLVRMTVVLAAEEAAVVEAAIESASRRAQGSSPKASSGTEPDASLPLDDVPAGTSQPPETAPTSHDVEHSIQAQTCHIEGQGPIEAATAQRLACTATLLGAVVTASGDVLALGRTTRLATRAQRRALRIRDRSRCQFPGCSTTHHLDAHHLVQWSQGGPTDLDNLILLCRRHHVFVHEGGIRLTRQSGTTDRFAFALPSGEPITGTWRAKHDLPIWLLADDLARAMVVDDPASPARIFPRHAGAGFSLHACVEALFNAGLPQVVPAA
ncbi:HNH endonuclease [Aestuariimicrobium ganziense]|uniref:HNH endonuclease n=1 Tax=Aestuariimicrobium ganziense TaxID=2773677 RepID=UPI0019431194|nr:HNH endonuclease signature motif containing protein [Aestuariimicrobium ganziense]